MLGSEQDYERVETAVVGAIQEILRRVSETPLGGGPESNAALQQLTMKSLGKERDLSGTIVSLGNCVFGNKE